ncbi:hypothetical protein [Nocardia nova]|uniref:hypothetical protein n=1 Tax=Nocardia nova TaxID=37330 RepID=UPI000CEA6FFD|nr:hypothetical protein [Nocardia nova]PPI89225.1 hypothetical protein C5E46_34465 [Nocardia nova]
MTESITLPEGRTVRVGDLFRDANRPDARVLRVVEFTADCTRAVCTVTKQRQEDWRYAPVPPRTTRISVARLSSTDFLRPGVIDDPIEVIFMTGTDAQVWWT